MKRSIFVLLFLVIVNSPVYSYDSKDLKQVEQEISAHKKKSSELDKQAKANEKELKSIQNKSIKIAQSLQANANQINSVKTEMYDLDAGISIKEMELERNQENSQAVLSSLVRIASVPADGFVIASDNPQELINTRILLNSAIPHLREQAKQLQEDIDSIEESKQAISDKRDKLTSLNTVSKKEMKELEKLIGKKKSLKSKLTAEQKTEKAELNKLAKQASSMKDFINKLQSRKVKATPGTKPNKPIKPIREVFSKKGKLPIAGKITLGYGKKNPQDVTNYGWEMLGNSKGLVTCPIDGEVLFSGSFASYNQMIVFDNGSGYNLVLAGMDKVGVDVGDNVKSGEPVGFLTSNPAKLYLEVRKNGNPIDPKKVLK